MEGPVDGRRSPSVVVPIQRSGSSLRSTSPGPATPAVGRTPTPPRTSATSVSCVPWSPGVSPTRPDDALAGAGRDGGPTGRGASSGGCTSGPPSIRPMCGGTRGACPAAVSGCHGVSVRLPPAHAAPFGRRGDTRRGRGGSRRSPTRPSRPSSWRPCPRGRTGLP